MLDFCFWVIPVLSFRSADQGHLVLWQAAQQDPHALCEVLEKSLPHSEEEVWQLWISLCSKEALYVEIAILHALHVSCPIPLVLHYLIL